MFCKSCCSTYGDFELCTSCYRAQHVQQVRQRKAVQETKVATVKSASANRLVLDEAALTLADMEFDEQVRKRGSLYVGGRNAKSVADQKIREANNTKKRPAQEVALRDTMPSSGGKVPALGVTMSSPGGMVAALADTMSLSDDNCADSESQWPLTVTIRAGAAEFECIGEPTRYENFLSYPSLLQSNKNNPVEFTAGTVVLRTCLKLNVIAQVFSLFAGSK